MAGKMMQAVQYSSFGGGASALKHVEIPVPTPGKDQVLVKVEAASVNPIDWKVIQAGSLKFIMPAKLPHTPGTDIAGEVVGLGPGVTTFAIGDKVLSWTDIKYGGSLAEYATAPIKTTAKRPEGVSAIDGACLGVAGTTALQSVRDTAGVKLDGSAKGKNLLITAASGGVGTYAVQVYGGTRRLDGYDNASKSITLDELAKLGGAHVTATCGARNIALVKSLGADEVLDYKSPEGARLESPSGKKYDAVIHCSKFQPFSFFKPQLARGAKVIDLTPTGRGLLATGLQLATFASQRFIPFLMSANAADLAVLADLVRDGKLKTVVDSTYPLSRAEDAWAKQSEGHSTGKIVVTMVGE